MSEEDEAFDDYQSEEWGFEAGVSPENCCGHRRQAEEEGYPADGWLLELVGRLGPVEQGLGVDGCLPVVAEDRYVLAEVEARAEVGDGFGGLARGLGRRGRQQAAPDGARAISRSRM